MKLYHLMLCAGVSLWTACQPAAKETLVEGCVAGLESDTLLVNYRAANDLQGRGFVVNDTVVAKNGCFSYKVEKDSLPVSLYLYPNPGSSTLYRTMEILALPGETVTVSGSMSDYKLEGNAFYEAYSAMKAQREPYHKKVNAVTDVVMGLQGTEKWTPQVSDSLRALYQTALDSLMQFQEKYIRSHADEDVSVYLLSNMGRKYATDLLPLLGERARTGVLSSVYQAMEEALKIAQERDAAKNRIKEGAEAPDFTLKDIHGKDFALSSLRGRYVVLDFWGSWCGWCIKGFPDMKKYYDKYKDQMEIVGIDCNDTEERWKKAVADNDLPWMHVRNANASDVTVMYGISGYPTKIVVDPQGKILYLSIGEDPAFYKYLDGLFK